MIGAGSAGAVVAARLSEDPGRRVLLVEAGGTDRRLAVTAPLLFRTLFGGPADWDLRTEPEPGCADRRLTQPRGRILGGTSCLNAMVWVRGSAADYDGWGPAGRGLPGWSWREVEPVFHRIEDHFLAREHAARADPGARRHGTGGPITVTHAVPHPHARAFADAAGTIAARLGIGPTRDIGGPDLAGVAPTPVSVRDGRRRHTAHAYLRPARRRPNLTVLTGTLAHRVLVEDGRARAVLLEGPRSGGRPERVEARRGVILAAGAFHTPYLLQLSGIGPREVLDAAGIPTLLDSPHVGAHLVDHPLAVVNWELAEGLTGLETLGRADVLRWLLRHDGPVASTGFDVMGHLPSAPDRPAGAAPDLQLGFAPAYFADEGRGTHPRPAATVVASHWEPRSEGHVRVAGADARRSPVITLNLLTDPEGADLRALTRALALVREIAGTEPLAGILGRELNPGPEVRTPAQVGEWLRRTAQTTYHPACSARMGRPGEGVLDERLRVCGVDGLRVADASAFPVIPHANTNAAAIMLGERCAEFLREEDPV
ncbi:GMC family oxidoreductase (plasmid) [Streptomyces sp. BI20]|uniref:GMC family oxidoreductase n=1 Tax=Streptomyces sp. BI20 TaxID=3403460 RepID=UPI003C70EBBB